MFPDCTTIITCPLPFRSANTDSRTTIAVKSVGVQKDVDAFAAVIRDYVLHLTAFQTTHNSDLIRRLETFLEEQRLNAPTPEPTPARTAIWLNKYDSDADFVGREWTMVEIERQLKERNHRVALTGIGGVGYGLLHLHSSRIYSNGGMSSKSRIAIQYCHRFRQQHPEIHIFWVFGGSKFRFKADYQRLAIAFDLDVPEDDEIDTLRRVCDWLTDHKNGPWLMVLDSADDDGLWLGSPARGASARGSLPLIDYLPRCDHGGIIVTTRDSQLGHRLTESKQNPIQVLRFERDDARVLLTAKLSEDKDLSREDADELTGALEYLPLTITQAAAYLRQIDISASEYLQLLRAGDTDIPNLLEDSIDDPGRDRETSNSIFQTWKLSFDQILHQSPAAADMLSLMAVLDRQAISQELLRRPEESLLEFKVAVSKLKAFSLITEDKSSSKYSLHRLVQLSTRKWLEHYGTLSMWEEAALAAVARLIPTVVEYKVWPVIQDLSSHAHIVLKYSITTRPCQMARANILHGLGHYCLEQGDDKSALDILLESRELRVENLGPEHEDTLTTLSLLSVAYSKLNRSREAHELQVEVWETTDYALGPSHPLTLKCMSRLAITYNKQGEYRRAEELQIQTLEAMERELGVEAKVTMTEMSNLAFTYIKLQKWEEAEELGLKTLNLRKQALGPNHPDTLTIMATLARVYRAQARWEEAEQLERKTLKHRLEILGPDHPKTLLTMHNLAKILASRKSWSEAEELQQQVLEGHRRMSGPGHFDTLRAEQYLAWLQSARKESSNGKSSSPRLVVPNANNGRRRARSLRISDRYPPPYARSGSSGSLSPFGSNGDYYRPRPRSTSPYNEGRMDSQLSSNWRKR